MMLIRTAIRAPLVMIFAIVMAFVMGGSLAFSFVIIVPFLAFGLFLVSRKAMPAFRSVFKKYDKLNESIEENVRAMRVVKGFSREDYEKEKFGIAAENIRANFTKAERIVAFNTPLMQICLYFNMIFVMLVGSKMIITGVGNVDVGKMSAMLTYGMQILMQLMMLSMIYVILTMSSESMKRIYEVLKEEPALQSPENAIAEVKDGSIDFDKVSFKYSEKAEKFAQMEKLCDEALQQIEDRRYEDEYLEEGYKGVDKYGICFCKKTCMVKNNEYTNPHVLPKSANLGKAQIRV